MKVELLCAARLTIGQARKLLGISKNPSSMWNS